MANNNYESSSYPNKKYSPADPTKDIDAKFWRELCGKVDEARHAVSIHEAEQRMAQGGDSPLSPQTIERIVNDVAKSRKENALETEI